MVVWLSDCKLYLPVPFSFFLVVWIVVFLPIMKCWVFFTCMDKEKDQTEEDHLPLAALKARKKHSKLIQELIICFINKSKIKQKMSVKGKNVHRHESKCWNESISFLSLLRIFLTMTMNNCQAWKKVNFTDIYVL